jgi:hypothetical protein
MDGPQPPMVLLEAGAAALLADTAAVAADRGLLKTE